MGKKRSTDELRYELWFKIVDKGAPVLQTLFWALASVGIAYFMFRAVDSLAGETTAAEILIALLGRFDVSKGLLAAWGAGGTAYGLFQRKLKSDHTQRMSERNAKLEKERDPNRTSSNLTPRGRTRPEDRP